jgi:hypothetical protein
MAESTSDRQMASLIDRVKDIVGLLGPVTLVSVLLMCFGYIGTGARLQDFGVSLDMAPTAGARPRRRSRRRSAAVRARLASVLLSPGDGLIRDGSAPCPQRSRLGSGMLVVLAGDGG